VNWIVKLVAHPFHENMEINETWREQVNFLLLPTKSCWMYESRCKQKSLFEKMNRNNKWRNHDTKNSYAVIREEMNEHLMD